MFVRSIIIALLLLPFNLWATDNAAPQETLLAVISSDYKKSKTYNLSVLVDQQNKIVGIQTINNKKHKVKKYPASKLREKITLVKAVGISLISLTCKNFNPQTGCEIEIEYPYNLTYGKFKKFRARLGRHNNSWALFNGSTPFKSLHLVAKKFLGILIGIKRLETR